MFETKTIIMFFTASALLSLAPGPDNIFVLTQSMFKGTRAGVIITLGLCTGLLVHTSAVSCGLAVLFKTYPLAFTILKIIGAAYLLYLSFMSFKHADIPRTSSTADMPLKILYRRGIIMNVSNPKVSLFFLAFLPQFTDAARGSLPVQLMLLGGMFIITALVIFSLISFSASLAGKWFMSSKHAAKCLNYTAGTIFACFAVKLVFF